MITTFLNACSTFPPEIPATASENYQRAVAELENWSLRGRLNIRNGSASDTININWLQIQTEFEINLSGPLSIGAVRISGNSSGVIIEKAGEEPLVADNLQEISNDILGFAFPTSSLLYWIKALPAPGSSAQLTRTPEGLIATLSQADRQGRHWELQYDRYRNTHGIILPGRIRMEQTPYRLTFSINEWSTETEGQGD